MPYTDEHISTLYHQQEVLMGDKTGMASSNSQFCEYVYHDYVGMSVIRYRSQDAAFKMQLSTYTDRFLNPLHAELFSKDIRVVWFFHDTEIAHVIIKTFLV